MQRYERFVVAPMNGAPANEYRVVRGRVEFRIVDSSHTGRSVSSWRTLSTNDILMHLSLNTEVAKWLMKRLVLRTAA